MTVLAAGVLAVAAAACGAERPEKASLGARDNSVPATGAPAETHSSIDSGSSVPITVPEGLPDPVDVTGVRIGDPWDSGPPADWLASEGPIENASIPVWSAVGRDGFIIGYVRNDLVPLPPGSDQPSSLPIFDELARPIGYFDGQGNSVLYADEE